MRPRSSILVITGIGVLFLLGCHQTSQDTGHSNSTPAASKTEASPEDLDEARGDIAKLKEQLKTKSPEELIASFIPPGTQRYGGYDYYYGYMANAAIRAELQSRAAAARQALERHANDDIRIFEGANGPGDTIGRICQQLISEIGNAATRPAT